MIRGGEIELDSGSFFDRFVVVELGAVVERDGVEAGFELADGYGHSARGLGHVSRFEFLDDEKSGDAFDEGQDAVALVSTHDGIALPVTLLSSVFNFCGSFTDMSLSEQTAASSRASTTFSAELAQDAQVRPKLSALSTVASNVAVDGLFAHHLSPRQSLASDNLCGAPKADESPGYRRPVAGTIA